MKRLSSISIYREDQPGEPAWSLLKSLAAQWNRTHEPKMNLVFGEFFRLANIDLKSAAYSALKSELAQLEKGHGVRYAETIDETPEADDLSAADYVWVQGVSLDGLGSAQFSDDSGMGPVLSCESCGSADPWSRERRSPFVIQESLLKGRAQHAGEIYLPSKDGWDFVNLPAGGAMAVSMRAIGWMNELGATGFETLPLTSAKTGRRSKRMVELMATHAHVMPCLKHFAEPITLCPTCGTVLSGALPDGWSIQRCLVAQTSVWSRHRLKANAMYFSRQLYEGLTARGVQGLSAEGTVMTCEHACPDAGAKPVGGRQVKPARTRRKA